MIWLNIGEKFIPLMTDHTITVLHVDDNPQFRDLAKTYLERGDSTLSVISEPSAAAGLEQLRQQGIDCVVSDYEMDGTDGLEFLNAVRTEFPGLPFVLYTGKGSEEIAAKAVNAGVDAYHQKQVGTGQYAVLTKHVKTLVEKHRAEQRLDHLERNQHLSDGGLETVTEDRPVEHPDSMSMAVVKAVAAREGVDPIKLTPPFGATINPDAVDALFPPETDAEEQAANSLTLTYQGYTVTIHSDGRVVLDE